MATHGRLLDVGQEGQGVRGPRIWRQPGVVHVKLAVGVHQRVLDDRPVVQIVRLVKDGVQICGSLCGRRLISLA